MKQEITDVQPRTKPIPRFYKDDGSLESDSCYGIEIPRSGPTRCGKVWKQKMQFLGEILRGLYNLSRNEQNVPYYHVNASALVQVCQIIMNSVNGFHFDRDVQAINHEIHVQPFWRKGDIKRRITGYAVTQTTKVIKGGNFNTFEFPVPSYLQEEAGADYEVKERDLLVSRFELIDSCRLASDMHPGLGRVSITPDGRDLVVDSVVVDIETGEKTWVCAGRLQVGWK